MCVYKIDVCRDSIYVIMLVIMLAKVGHNFEWNISDLLEALAQL